MQEALEGAGGCVQVQQADMEPAAALENETGT